MLKPQRSRKCNHYGKALGQAELDSLKHTSGGNLNVYLGALITPHPKKKNKEKPNLTHPSPPKKKQRKTKPPCSSSSLCRWLAAACCRRKRANSLWPRSCCVFNSKVPCDSWTAGQLDSWSGSTFLGPFFWGGRKQKHKKKTKETGEFLVN